MESFPPLDTANEDGLLAIGGDLSPERLVLAYRNGVFPWYNPGDPILWWSPDPRCVLFPGKLHVSRSLAKSIRKRGYYVTCDTAFERVIASCAKSRAGQPGTWISNEMRSAYVRLYQIGVAHSVETWCEGQLVGGLYGITLGSVFFGESMFSFQTDASKVALAFLDERLVAQSFSLIDCQVESPHLLTLGAECIPRTEFAKRLESGLCEQSLASNWRP